MKPKKRFALVWLAALGLLCGSVPLAAQQTAPAGNTPISKEQRKERGWVLTETFEGSSSRDGKVMDLNTRTSYVFSKYFYAYAGVPVYFVVPPASQQQGRITRTSTGLGNAYVGFGINLDNPIVAYRTSLMGSLPTGSRTRGFSTGRATYSWDNNFEHDFGRVAPFVNIAVGNTLNEGRFFHRPFLTLGQVASFEGGLRFHLWRLLSFSASAYNVSPWGQQHVFSRFTTRKAGAGNSTSNDRRAFRQFAETVGGADLVRDNGFSAGFDVGLGRAIGLSLGYTRSIPLRLDTVSWGIIFNLTELFHRAPGK